MYSLKTKREGEKKQTKKQILLYCSLLGFFSASMKLECNNNKRAISAALPHLSVIIRSHRVWVHTYLNVSYQSIILFIFHLDLNVWLT